MVPAITAGGRSFRGAALYYLHDKRRDGEAERLTTEPRGVGRDGQLADRRPGTGMADHGPYRACARPSESGGRDQGDRAQAGKARVRL